MTWAYTREVAVVPEPAVTLMSSGRDVYVVEVTGGGSGSYDSRVLVRIVPDGNR